MTGEKTEVADGRYVAVVDRFEETDPARSGGERDAEGRTEDGGRELAVLLLESGESVVAERAIPAWRLPADARRQDAVLELSVKNGFVVSMTHDSEETERRTDSAQSRFDRLAERPGEDDES
ncbi:DUF3006 domain-containing protein [Halorussus salinus]|uniref:DUF3006 domain-containing protein n=1 Tax=Halorussus salinus TaxID=1364935 RepID=UPI001092B524|nr:DUF3006 domain-containing protein [Halorussus salinus]